MQKDDSHLTDFKSKSQKKREMTSLQKLGESLIALTPAQLAKIPLSSELHDAICFAQTLKNNEAKRRHLQYIGKLMRTVDAEAIQTAVDKISHQHQQSNAQFHQMERWRDQLIAGDDEILEKFLNTYPNCDRQHLRQLIRNAKKDIKENKNSGKSRELFKYLREVIDI